MNKEEEDLAKAIALSLIEEHTRSPSRGSTNIGASGSTSLYPSYPSLQQAQPKPVQMEIRKVRALYDFEAAEDNELTFKTGELICVLDDGDQNWWKGSNHRGEGLFPANFVTTDLTTFVEPEPIKDKKSVQFSDNVQVQNLALSEEEIDEAKIDEALTLIQNADPTGEQQADSSYMLMLEEQCRGMGPLIDAELEKIDRKHASLVELNKKVMDALQMYHSLMKDTPVYGYTSSKTSQGAPGTYSSWFHGAGNNTNMVHPSQAYHIQPHYLGPGAVGGHPSEGQPNLSMANPSHSYSQTQVLPSAQQAYHGSVMLPMTNYSTSGVMAAQTGTVNHIATHQHYGKPQDSYSQAPPLVSNTYHIPATQKPIV